MKESRSGFTLIELIITIAFVLIIFAVLLTGVMHLRARMGLSRCETNLKNMGIALDKYAADFEGKFPADLYALSPRFMEVIPTCPSGKLFYHYKSAHNPERYTMWCGGGDAHILLRVSNGYPQFDSKAGIIEKK